MSFQFRFASILQLRRQQRDEVGASVGQAVAAIAQVDRQVAEVEQERLRLRQDDSRGRVGSVSVDSLLTSGRYDLQLQADISSLQQTRVQLVQELERRQTALSMAESEVKRFEKLEEKDRAEHRLQMLCKEQAEADDATARRFTLQRQRARP